ncbi:MAG: hypothetical protein AB8F78_04015 [Saprospiraceae bacterium]
MAIKGISQPYSMVYDSLDQSAVFAIPTQVNEVAFFDVEDINSDSPYFVDTVLAIGFPFVFMGVNFDSLETKNGLGGVTFGNTPFSFLAHVTSLGQFIKHSGSPDCSAGFYRTDTSLVVFYSNVTYKNTCENLNSSRSFSVALEITSSNAVIVSIFNPLVSGCDDYVPGRGFLVFGGLVSGPRTYIVLDDNLGGSRQRCGLLKPSEHNSSIYLSCESVAPAWQYAIDQSFSITYTYEGVSSTENVPPSGPSYRIEDDVIRVSADDKSVVPFDLYGFTGRRIANFVNEFDVSYLPRGVYVVHSYDRGVPYAWKVFIN